MSQQRFDHITSRYKIRVTLFRYPYFECQNFSARYFLSDSEKLTIQVYWWDRRQMNSRVLGKILSIAQSSKTHRNNFLCKHSLGLFLIHKVDKQLNVEVSNKRHGSGSSWEANIFQPFKIFPAFRET